MEKDLKQTKKSNTIKIEDENGVTEYGFSFDTIEEPVGLVCNPEEDDQDGDK